MGASFSGFIERIRSGVAEVFADTSSESDALSKEQQCHQRVETFRQAVSNGVYITPQHQAISGKDVLAELDSLGVAFGADPDFSKDRKYEHIGGPGLAMRTVETAHAQNISSYPQGSENGSIPTIRVATHLTENTIEIAIRNMQQMAETVKAYRDNPDQLRDTQKDAVDRELKDLQRSDKDAYKDIILGGSYLQSPQVDLVIHPEYGGRPYRDSQDRVITRDQALDSLLGREAGEARVLEAEA